jgi:hypothetical protein
VISNISALDHIPCTTRKDSIFLSHHTVPYFLTSVITRQLSLIKLKVPSPGLPVPKCREWASNRNSRKYFLTFLRNVAAEFSLHVLQQCSKYYPSVTSASADGALVLRLRCFVIGRARYFADAHWMPMGAVMTLRRQPQRRTRIGFSARSSSREKPPLPGHPHPLSASALGGSGGGGAAGPDAASGSHDRDQAVSQSRATTTPSTDLAAEKEKAKRDADTRYRVCRGATVDTRASEHRREGEGKLYPQHHLVTGLPQRMAQLLNTMPIGASRINK